MGRGALIFKGDKKPKSKSKSKKKKKTVGDSSNIVIASSTIHSSSDLSSSTSVATKGTTTTKTPQIQKGTGRILSSGTVVTGISTKFSKEIASGDAIMIIQPNRPKNSNRQGEVTVPQEEMRIVTMCLSDTSCAISSSFSSDLKYPLEFTFVSKPRDEGKEKERKRLKEEEDWMETERTAFGTYGSGNSTGGGGGGRDGGGGRGAGNSLLVYRKKTETGSYVIKREKLNKDVTRDDLLNMRMKKKSDRYC